VGELHVLKRQEQRAGEAGQRREQDAGQDAVGEHVAGALDRVVAAGNHVAEPHRVRAVDVVGLTGDGVETHRRAAGVLVRPVLDAVLLDDVRGLLAQPAGHTVGPDARRFDDVVIGAEQPQ
jgi:hypothetical protein